MADGSLKNVQDIEDGEMILALDENYNFVTSSAFLSYNGKKETVKISLNSRPQIRTSLNHPFLQRKKVGRETTGKRRAIFADKWIEAKDLRPGDFIAVPNNVGDIGQEDFDQDERYLQLIGFLLTDGNTKGGNYRFSNDNEEILNKMSDCLSLLRCKLKQYDCDEEANHHIVCEIPYSEGWGKKGQFRQWLETMELYDKGAYEKSIPDFILKLKRKYIAKLLNAMYGCDGWVSRLKSSIEIGYCTVSLKMAEQVTALLLRFGIFSSCETKKVKYKDGIRIAYQVQIRRFEDVKRFSKLIGICGKQKKLDNYLLDFDPKISFKTEAYTENDLCFTRVSSILLDEESPTWDLTVPKYHNFIANNILVHNSEVLVISILFNLFTKEKFNVELIAPYQSQVDLVFTRIVELIRSNTTLSNSIERSVKAPNYQIILKNDSKLIGFTAGTRSGQEAGAARGQNANMLVFDEADYLSPKDVDAALAVIINHPDATVWMSSTPTGRREKFYDTCQNRLYREFNFPSMINPNWDEALDRYYRSELTEDGWLHEIEAKFGNQEEGVYQVKYVEAAQDNFEYGLQNLDPTHIYTIGVDWNDVKVGTTIAVVGYNPRTGMFSLVDKDIVSRAERTQLSACEKIAELNRIWNPVSIYVDSGYGQVQIEVLHDFGQQAVMRQGANSPDARLRNIVKEYDFGSSIEIHDLFTHQPVKKPAKPFLVENSVRRFENLTFKYPVSDKSYSDQLMGYIVERVSNTGRPVYKARNENVGDHFLDAVNLALVAFTLEKGKFGKPTLMAGVTFAPRFGETGNSENRKEVPKESYSKTADHYKPEGGRASFAEKNKRILPSAHGDMPAANMARNNSKLWEWPGWGRDAPRPNVRTWEEALSAAEKRSRGPRQSRPQRAKF
jgi:replicative DNA helicase